MGFFPASFKSANTKAQKTSRYPTYWNKSWAWLSLYHSKVNMNQWHNPSNHDQISPNHLRFRIKWGRVGAQNIGTLSEWRRAHYSNEEKARLEMGEFGERQRRPPSQLGHGSNMALPMLPAPPHLISPWALVPVTLLQVSSCWNISRSFFHPYSWSFCSFFLICPPLYTHKHYLSSCSSINVPLKYSHPSPRMQN